MSKDQRCIHCLRYYKSLTKDHIFPTSWYPDSTDLNIEKWTVPSCEKCNHDLGIIEEEIFDRLIMCVDENDVAASGVSKKIKVNPDDLKDSPRAKGRQIKFWVTTIKNFVSYPYQEGNIHVLKNSTPEDGKRTTKMIRTPTDKLFRVSEKIIKGLEYKLRNRFIEKDRRLQIVTPHAHNKVELDLIAQWATLMQATKQSFERGPGFIIEYAVHQTNPNWVIYKVLIWNYLEIWAMIGDDV